MDRRLGRYLVLETLGEGGMGAVYAAYDPELDRRVALKLLKPIIGADPEPLRNRLLREAQAMARLSHPNVVAVYDVGTVDDQVFIAMELVEGTTVAAWLERATPPWREVLGVFCRAGEGLAAAHGAGLVHRDFKPANVLLGREGAVKVTDFGLAVAVSEVPVAQGSTAYVQPAQSPNYEHSTSALMVGTPAYMSPEQAAGRPFDARADQFSFCVALYEGLFGSRPSADASSDSASASEARTSAPEPRLPKPVPSWVVKPIRRGLSSDAAKRFPSMRALLDALSADPVRRRNRLILGGVFAALLVGGLAGGATWIERRRAQCHGAEAQLSGAWDASKRQLVTEAFQRAGVPYAADVLAPLDRTLTARASSWAAMHVEACEATLHGEQSESLLDLRMACLQQRLDELKALTDLFARANATIAEKAVEAADALPPVSECASTLALTSPTALPQEPQKRAALEELRRKLAQVHALTDTGQLRDAQEQVSPLVETAANIGFKPVEAEARFEQALIQQATSDNKSAEPALYATLAAADEARDDTVRARAWTSLIDVAREQARLSDGHRFAAQARAVLARLGDPPRLEAEYLRTLGKLDIREGHLTDATVELQRALERARSAYGEEHTEVAAILQSLGAAQRDAGRYADARTQVERSLAITEKKLGPKHPLVANGLYLLATIYRRLGEYGLAWDASLRALAARESLYGPNSVPVGRSLNGMAILLVEQARYRDAEPYLRRSLAIFEPILGPEHPDVAAVLNNLANATMNWDSAGAQKLRLRALAIQEHVLGPDHIEMANTRTNLAWTEYVLGQYPEALADLERAIAIRSKQPGPGTSELANDYDMRGDVLDATGKPREGLSSHRQALSIRETVLGPTSPFRASSLTRMARSYLAMQEPVRALPLVEQALALDQGGKVDPSEVALGHFTLARALLDTGQDKARALTLGTQARTEFAQLNIEQSRYLTELDAWLARNRPEAPAQPPR
jgi:eukaryotic-like serine/threonine-protein kinase